MRDSGGRIRRIPRRPRALRAHLDGGDRLPVQRGEGTARGSGHRFRPPRSSTLSSRTSTTDSRWPPIAAMPSWRRRRTAATWHVRNGSLPAGYGQSEGYPGQFEFEGTDGYLWGGAPGTDGAAPLWVTSDGGVSWHAAPVGPVVYDVSAIGTNVWALVGTCNAETPGAGPAVGCALTMEQSSDAGASWHVVGTRGFADVMSPTPSAQGVELARITTSRSYVLTASAPDASDAIALSYTGDGGVTWQARPGRAKEPSTWGPRSPLREPTTSGCSAGARLRPVISQRSCTARPTGA